MNAGQVLLLARDLTVILVADGILLPDGTFDGTKLDQLPEDLAFAAQVERALKPYGIAVPDRIERILTLLPLVAQLVG